ncbi:MAG: lantibiotic dehydratase [Waddliaceae bacterium]
MECQSIYTPANFFMVRYANLPFTTMSILEEENSEALFQFYQNNPLFQEAVAVASFSLHQGLRKWRKAPDKTSLYLSLSKYLIRMSSRATPFGLFSSVGWGRFSETTEMSFDPNLLKKRVSLGTECIGELIETLHKDRKMVSLLKVMLNPQLIYKNSRVYLNKGHPHFKENYSSIKITSAFERVHELAKAPIEYHELEEQITLHFPMEYKEKAQHYVWELFQKNFLISQLIDPSVIGNFLTVYSQILEKAGNTPGLPIIIAENIEEIQHYERASQNEALEVVEKIMKELKAWKQDIANPLRVDHFYDSNQILLHKNVRKTVEKAVDVLTKISFSKKQPRSLLDFHRFFLETYGSDHLVPFYELVQKEWAFKLLSSWEKASDNNEISSIESYISTQNQQEEINIEAFIDSLHELTLQEKEKLPPTMELYFEIEASGKEAIEENRFTLLTKGVSHQAGSMIGRFLYFWGEDKNQEIFTFIENEKNLFPHLLVVEPSFVPDKHKVGNVSIGGRLRLMQLPMHYHEADEHTINLEDIYLGANHDMVYLFSKKWKKELVVSSSIMTNPLFMPLPLRLLLFLSQFQMHKFSDPFQFFAKKRVYFPRIIYQNIVLSPAQWHLSYSFLNIDRTTSKEKLKSILRDAFEIYYIPSTILLVQGDNHLQLDWKKDLYFDLIINEFIKNKEIILYEQRNKKHCLFVGTEEKRHMCEFVSPMIKSSSMTTNKRKEFYPRTHQLSLEECTFFPGGKWWYAKIFLSSNDSDFFISQFLFSYIEFLENQFKPFRWFYTRYYDEGRFHLRLRVLADTERLKQELIPRLNEWIASLAVKGEIEDFSLCTYRSEVERYGGPKCIDLVENVFSVDSRCILKILASGNLPFPPYLIASLGMINILHRFFPDIQQMMAAITPNQDQIHLLDGIRSYSKLGIELTKAILMNRKNTIKNPHLQFLMECYCQTQPALDTLARTLAELEKKGDAWQPITGIVHSIMHMHCNRLLGTSSLIEQKSQVIAHYLLEKASFQLQNVLKKKNHVS